MIRLSKTKRLNTTGKVLDNTTSAIIVKQDEIIQMLNTIVEKLIKEAGD